jgi:hypothetical protein
VHSWAYAARRISRKLSGTFYRQETAKAGIVGDMRKVAKPLVLGRKLPLDARLPGGRTALAYAVALGDEELVKILLEKRANPNVHCRAPPLITAARSGRIDIAKILLDHGDNL